MAASWAPSSIMWWSFTMAPCLCFRVFSVCGSRLHHWLPMSPRCPCYLRDEVLSLYPTTGSAFPMDMGQRSSLCRSGHPPTGPLSRGNFPERPSTVKDSLHARFRPRSGTTHRFWGFPSPISGRYQLDTDFFNRVAPSTHSGE